MFIFIVFLSYFIGCISTIVILIYLYMCYGLYPLEPVDEQNQYQTFHPLSENDKAKNSTIDAVNYLFQFLFQEMKDTFKIRHYIMEKLKIEFSDIKKTKLGNILIQDISILSFTLGKECPILHDLQLERQERDGHQLIKEVVAKVNFDYKDGFSVTLDIKLVFGYKFQLFLKVKRIQGRLRLEFRREPFSHWLGVFQDEPVIDFEIKAYISSRESPPIAHIISQQFRRIIRRKHTWPSYKIRYPPFFTRSRQSLSTEILSSDGNSLIPGLFDISIQYCDRLSIPFEVYNKDEYFSLSIILTININEEMCEDYLHINRDQWKKQTIKFQPKLYKISIKEVKYMNRTEFLIDQFDPILNEIDDKDAFKAALEEKNVFLLEVQGQKVNTLKQINRLMRDNGQQIEVLVGMPVLHSVSVPYQTVEIEQSTDSDNSIQQQDFDLTKRKKLSMDKTTLIMMNNDLLQTFQAKAVVKRFAERIEFNRNFEFEVGPTEQYLNICLWCKPPLNCDVPNYHKKLVLLGYATIALSEIVLDTQMSFGGETQTTLNFQSVYSDSQLGLRSKKLEELSKHRNYDSNLAHGFVTINIKHQPDFEIKLNQEEKRERPNSTEPVIIEKDDELFRSINMEQEALLRQSMDHIFEDETFSSGVSCTCCNKKIWMKVGRRCRNCSATVHKKCEDKYNNESICTNESFDPKSTLCEDENSILPTDEIDSQTTTTTHHISRKLNSTAGQSFQRFRNKKKNQTLPSNLSETSGNDESDNNSSPHTEKRLSIQTSSKLANATSSAFSRFRDFTTKRSSITESSKTRLPSELTANENISEDDLQDIITRCLSHENIDLKSLEKLFHEKAVDHTKVYANANQFGEELFQDYTLVERREKVENEISRLQQDIDLESRIRDEMIIDFNNIQTDENAKRKIQEKIANIDEKIQALAALTIFYCSGLRFCCAKIDSQDDNSNINSKTLSENSSNQLNDSDNEQ